MLKTSRVVTVIALFLFAFSMGGCGGGGSDSSSDSFTLTSTAFNDGGTIPGKYAHTQCNGSNISPPLSWSNPPQNTNSLAIIMDDPDAGNFTHWVVYDIPSTVSQLQEDFQASGDIKEGQNDFGGVGYGGPCPPQGETHRYQFKIYALAVNGLGLANGATRDAVESAMQNEELGTGVLTGKYGW